MYIPVFEWVAVVVVTVVTAVYMWNEVRSVYTVTPMSIVRCSGM